MSRRDFFEYEKKKKMITTFSLSILLAIVVFVTVFVMYSQKLDNDAENNLLALIEDDTVVPNEELEPTSYSKDKTVQNTNKEESVQVELENTLTNTENIVNNTSKENKEPVSAIVNENSVNKEEISQENENSNTETDIELCFEAPVSGEILKDFAMETLVYSKTLDEWCTHSGIDIKAEKTGVVMASESGTIESIKNDPRYGLTVIIVHNNGFKTIYSNLLTAEFVQEGEKVDKGQTIATVGESASFEIADETHLHFEMYKDGIAVNPTIYFK